MAVFVKPHVAVSKCLGFAFCRWNGQSVPDAFVKKLAPYVEYRPVCPEVEIGLGVPREPVRVVSTDNELHLMQPATGIDHTDKMMEFCNGYFVSIEDVDGAILKSRSPSCGIKDVKIYPSMDKKAAVGKGKGIFGAALIARFPNLPVEDEGRLRNRAIREQFLRRLYTIARFREIDKTRKMRDIVQFQANNKFLLMAYNQKEFRMMGRIVANRDKKSADEVYENYRRHLHNALAKAPRHKSYINVLMHTMGHFSDRLSKREKLFFAELIEKYRKGRIPLSSDLDVLLSWGVRFGEKYLPDQTFFHPYPEGLLDISDSGKGRDSSDG